jgi:FkbM family methyltransferase
MNLTKLAELVELRRSSRPELDYLWWPRYDQTTWHMLHNHPIEQTFFDELLSHIPQRRVMVQAGGNCGQYVKQYAKMFDTVYTFEPDSLNFLCLTLNCPGNVIKTQACVGNEKKFVDLDPHHGNNGDESGGIHVGGTGAIPTVVIDDLNLAACDLIQLDVEGYEYFSLLGAKQTIEKYHPVIIVEWYAPWANRYGVDIDTFQKFFNDLGYQSIINQDSDIVYKFVP